MACILLVAACGPGRSLPNIDGGPDAATASDDGPRVWFVETIAGNGEADWLDGPASQARFNDPAAIAFDASGTLFVSDCLNYRIRAVSQGAVSTVAGTGTVGFKDGPTSNALIGCSFGLLADGPRVYFSDGHAIRMIEGGLVTTVAGSDSWGGTWTARQTRRGSARPAVSAWGRLVSC